MEANARKSFQMQITFISINLCTVCVVRPPGTGTKIKG